MENEYKSMQSELTKARALFEHDGGHIYTLLCQLNTKYGWGVFGDAFPLEIGWQLCINDKIKAIRADVSCGAGKHELLMEIAENMDLYERRGDKDGLQRYIKRWLVLFEDIAVLFHEQPKFRGREDEDLMKQPALTMKQKYDEMMGCNAITKGARLIWWRWSAKYEYVNALNKMEDTIDFDYYEEDNDKDGNGQPIWGMCETVVLHAYVRVVVPIYKKIRELARLYSGIDVDEMCKANGVVICPYLTDSAQTTSFLQQPAIEDEPQRTIPKPLQSQPATRLFEAAVQRGIIEPYNGGYRMAMKPNSTERYSMTLCAYLCGKMAQTLKITRGTYSNASGESQPKISWKPFAAVFGYSTQQLSGEFSKIECQGRGVQDEQNMVDELIKNCKSKRQKQ